MTEETIMFKSKEELKKEMKQNNSFDIPTLCGYRQGISDAFKSITERKDFYKKYRNVWDNIEGENLLQKEQKSIFKEWIYDPRDDYNDWLFDFCFDGVE